MNSWLSQDLADQLIRERIAETAAQLRAEELVHQARAAKLRAANGQPHSRAGAPTARARGALAGGLRRLAVRLDPSLAASGR